MNGLTMTTLPVTSVVATSHRPVLRSGVLWIQSPESRAEQINRVAQNQCSRGVHHPTQAAGHHAAYMVCVCVCVCVVVVVCVWGGPYIPA